MSPIDPRPVAVPTHPNLISFMKIRFLLSALIGVGLFVASVDRSYGAEPPKKLVVGFAQTGAESAWRVANTESIKAEAEKRGIELRFVDGQSKQENQIAAVQSFVAAKVDAIILAPLVETGWDEVLGAAKRAGIPVVIMDRKLRVEADDLGVTFVGSDFLGEGRMAAEWLVKHAGDKTKLVELQGEPGSSAAVERRRSFAAVLAENKKFKMIASQSADFQHTKGRTVMEAMLAEHGREIEIVFTHNDDMAMGAIEAIEAAGLKPGQDILIVSIDALKVAVQAVADGKMNCTVECNPLFGPKVFDVLDKIWKGEAVPRRMFNKDELFDATNAAAALPSRKY
jgi:simple sugar transport system substrate-binding protein